MKVKARAIGMIRGRYVYCVQNKIFSLVQVRDIGLIRGRDVYCLLCAQQNILVSTAQVSGYVAGHHYEPTINLPGPGPGVFYSMTSLFVSFFL